MVVLVGLSKINPDSEFYSRRLPGFDGRAGCEGTGADIRRIHELSHYLGYELVTVSPLIDERATWANVIQALRVAAGELRSAKDILFIYFTCHGQTFGQAPIPRSVAKTSISDTEGSMASRYFVSAFLLYDRPIYNFEILEALTGAGKEGRVFTMIDACHAGLGTGLIDATGEAAGRLVTSTNAEIKMRIKGLQRLSNSPGFESVKSELTSYDQLLLNSLLGPKGPLLVALTFQIQSTNSQVFGINLDTLRFGQLDCHITHFGAARDIHQAQGGRGGSLFTRMFLNLWRNGDGHGMSYDRFMTTLKERLPDTQPPDYEWFSPNNNDHSSSAPPQDHFAQMQTVLSISNG